MYLLAHTCFKLVAHGVVECSNCWIQRNGINVLIILKGFIQCCNSGCVRFVDFKEKNVSSSSKRVLIYYILGYHCLQVKGEGA